MKLKTPQWALALLGGLFALHAGAADIPALPDSLGAWYKPENKRQVWLHTMFAMRRELQAVEEYATSGDMERIKPWTERLAKHYRSIPDMVPEWADEVELEQLTQLETAVQAGDIEATARTARGLGRSCRGCHRDYRALAAARFRTPDYGQLQVPHEGGSLPYADAMDALSRTVNRIKIAATDGRWEAASGALQGLRGQLNELGAVCSQCHQDAESKERILGAATQATFDQLAGHLKDQNLKQAGRSLGTAAVQVCARCHGIHRTLHDLNQRLME